jgi:hypothetical protein
MILPHEQGLTRSCLRCCTLRAAIEPSCQPMDLEREGETSHSTSLEGA